MASDLIIAIIAAMVNIVLSLLLPPLLKDSNLPFSEQIRKNYNCNRDIIMVSTALTITFVYISLQISPWVDKNIFSSLAKLGSKD